MFNALFVDTLLGGVESIEGEVECDTLSGRDILEIWFSAPVKGDADAA